MTHPDTKPEALLLADELREIDRAKRYHPSRPGGQMCGAEQYRLIATGWTFWRLHDAADKMESLHAECESLRTQLAEARAEAEALRKAAGQASFCLRELLPNDPDAQMTVRMIDTAMGAKEA